MPPTPATAPPRKIEPGLIRLIPETGWISLAKLKPGCEPDALERACQRLGIEVDTSDHRRAGLIRVEDIEKYVGPARARAIRYGNANDKPDMLRADAAAHLLGVFYSDDSGPVLAVSRGETIALAERRGVLVDRSPAVPVVSRSGLIWLKRILDVERKYPIADADWFDGEKALPEMRKASSVFMSPATKIDTSDFNNPRAVDAVETDLIDRCRLIGVRWKKHRGKPWEAPGPARVVGFDLFRLYGIEMPGADVATYREMMDAAHESVIPSKTSPVP